MGKDKLKKFAGIGTFSNVKQLEEGKEFKGNWAKKQFGNEKPLVLELACGKVSTQLIWQNFFQKKTL